jgi:hypothetical protein
MSGDLNPILDDLRDHWGDPYHIWFDDNRRQFGAIPRRGPIEDPLYADTADGLRQLIREDYEKENRSEPTPPVVA